MRSAKELHFSLNEHILISKHLTCEIYIRNQSVFQYHFLAVKKVNYSSAGLNVVQSFFSCLSVLKNPEVYLSKAKFN